jgi:hypothetical protein
MNYPAISPAHSLKKFSSISNNPSIVLAEDMQTERFYEQKSEKKG